MAQYKEDVSFMAKREVFYSSPMKEGWKVSSDGKTISHIRCEPQRSPLPRLAGYSKR
ncbi:hypothetical protein NXC24_PC01383 (plasmid) [Rhizobium sp. NXC24]|nr:hypothetical protein NXC24_PC01383 [Rhizobium sp. NXC24]